MVCLANLFRLLRNRKRYRTNCHRGGGLTPQSGHSVFIVVCTTSAPGSASALPFENPVIICHPLISAISTVADGRSRNQGVLGLAGGAIRCPLPSS
jgi:hypothetical protein